MREGGGAKCETKTCFLFNLISQFLLIVSESCHIDHKHLPP
jgi:hypothetical protein